MNGLEFGQLHENELEEAYELCTRTFGEFVTLENVRETYIKCKDNKDYHFIVGRCDQRIVAYATMALVYNLFDGTYPVAYLWYVCVHEDYRRQGVARALFREIDRIAAEKKVEIISLSCKKDNTPAVNFYRSLGFTVDEDIPFVKNIYEQWD